MAESGVQQSVKVEEADWIGGRLSPFDSCVVTSVVPSGFEAYTRVLHPLDPPARGQQPVRWADVASWSGIELVPGIDFPDIALPEHEPSGVEPWPGHVPQVGTLHGLIGLGGLWLRSVHAMSAGRVLDCGSFVRNVASLNTIHGPCHHALSRRFALAFVVIVPCVAAAWGIQFRRMGYLGGDRFEPTGTPT